MMMEFVKIQKEHYADIELPEKGNVTIEKYTLKNDYMSVEVINYGSTITSIKVPDKFANVQEITLGFDDINGYLSPQNPYAGATIGRVANRISNGMFKIGNETYHISRNIGRHTLHGGIRGFDKKLWAAHVEDGLLRMIYESCDMEEGFPGNLMAEATYSLTDDNELVISYKAKTDKPTAVNIVNHAYFNLAGLHTKSVGLYEHLVQINGDKYTLTDEDSIPTGEIVNVRSSYFDLLKLKNLGKAISNTPNSAGFDINYIIKGEGFREVARLFHPGSGRVMRVSSNQPGVQFYTGNNLNGIPGRDGIVFGKHDAVCFETQNFPDAVNHQGSFPPIILQPGSLYSHTVSFQFEVKTEDGLRHEPEDDLKEDKEKESM